MGREIFFALGDATRLEIVEILASNGGMCIADIADEFDLSRQAITRHLEVLCDAGLLHDRRHGRERYFDLQSDAFESMRSWLSHYDRFWSDKLGDLKSMIEERENK